MLATLLRKSTPVYRDLWIEQSRTSFATEPKAEVVSQHHGYWDAIVHAVDTDEFSELMKLAREAGHYQFASGLDLSAAVKRTVEATNMIEIALLEANRDEASTLAVITEIADLRSMIVMAVVSGYNALLNAAPERPATSSDMLRATLMRSPEKYASQKLAAGEEIGPLYDQEMRFYTIESGKLRLYNLLPNGRTITISILSEGDVFFQWRSQTGSLSCICAEAMQPSRVIAVPEKELIDLLGAQPAAAIDVIGNFARRLTESQVIIEELMNNSINLRLYRTLVELAREFGRPNTNGNTNAVVIDVPLTHQRLADMIGSNRVTVTRKLIELQKRGVIAARGTGSIEILDLDALNRLTAQAND
jgi:CRP/FNR family cyclic AMP-dependent transcriptional regulator